MTQLSRPPVPQSSSWPRLAPYGTLSRARTPARVGTGSAIPSSCRACVGPTRTGEGQLGGRVEIAGWDELQLVQRCKEGSEAAFAELVRRHRPRLFTLAFRLTGDRDAAEDVVQETFVAAFRTIDRFEPRPSLAAWLNAIAVHNAGKVAREGADPPQVVARHARRTTRRPASSPRLRATSTIPTWPRKPPSCAANSPRNRGSAVQIPCCGRDAVRARAGVRRGGGEPRDGPQHLQEPPASRHPNAARGSCRTPSTDSGARRRSARRCARQPGNGSRLRAGRRVAPRAREAAATAASAPPLPSAPPTRPPRLRFPIQGAPIRRRLTGEKAASQDPGDTSQHEIASLQLFGPSAACYGCESPSGV